MKNFFQEFKEFIARGNVVDLAVGVIVGTAFGKIVTSLVSDILTPAIGIVMGGIDFTGLNITIKDSIISYGNFIQNIIDFLIQAFCIFLFVKLINKFLISSNIFLLSKLRSVSSLSLVPFMGSVI